mmetsp:Transcript_7717/g.19681  ORF Transcript_7717/g.19681 Transcript_7717/m.19681 type:complete len:254 (+) Transcript_7717:85-846(+)
MVWFQCEDCGDTIKKPKLDQHFGRCTAQRFSCIDCCAVFDRSTVKLHTACVTEHEKYAEGATKPGGFASGGFAATESPANGACGSAGAVGLEHTSKRPPWQCFLCNVKCTSKENLLTHASCKKHRNKVKKLSEENASSAADPQGEEASPKEAAQSTSPSSSKPASGSKDGAPGDACKDEAADLGEGLRGQWYKWEKHTKKVLGSHGGKMLFKKLRKQSIKRIVKKSGQKKLSSAQKKLIKKLWKNKVRGIHRN